jgi:DNA-binding HxlR family transcriptional regulator
MRRSNRPVSVSLEILGDRWSLVVVRDLLVRGYRTFADFQHSGEGIATNVLSSRLRRLQVKGIIAAERHPGDARRVDYRLTDKGIDLAPVVLELLVWGARHERTGASSAVIDRMANGRESVLAEVRRR